MDHFALVHAEYERLRDHEQKSIATHLRKAGFHISMGKGRNNYTAGGRIAPFDLTNWKYVEASRAGLSVLVSLQTFDYDRHSRNHHVLFDRIGIYAYKTHEYNPEDAINKMKNSDIDLPMTTEKLCRLEAIIEEQMRKVEV